MISLIFYGSMHDVYLEMDDKAGDDEWQKCHEDELCTKIKQWMIQKSKHTTE